MEKSKIEAIVNDKYNSYFSRLRKDDLSLMKEMLKTYASADDKISAEQLAIFAYIESLKSSCQILVDILSELMADNN